jgi:HK97 family phage major capsid protein/HK97 family phage prohead protease
MTMSTTNRPVPGQVEERTAPSARAAPVIDGRRLHGLIPYGVESRDLGGFREVVEPGALAGADLSDLIATREHDRSHLLGRHPTTLNAEDRTDGFAWDVELPHSPVGEDVRVAVERGDLRSTSWRMVVGRDRWEGDVRHIEQIAALHDVTVTATPAYASAVAEYRSAPEPDTPAARAAQDTPEPEEGRPMQTESRQEAPQGGLSTEDRSAQVEERTLAQRVETALRSIPRGENRSLDTVNADPITPTEQATVLFDALRASSIALASGLRVIPTTRESITWPQLVTSVDPSWVAEAAVIPEGDPAFVELTATPRKLAHRVVFSNEVADDSEPQIITVLQQHLGVMLGLKLDLAIFEGNDANGVRGLKFTPGVQTVSMGTNGAALTDYDPIIEAVGMLQAANVPGPYALAAHPTVATALALLKDTTGVQLGRPADLPTLRTSSQLSTTETAGTSSDARSIYVYSPSQVVLVRRADAVIEVDRSRLFDSDQSEMRGKLRADLLVPNPVSVVRITGITTV